MQASQNDFSFFYSATNTNTANTDTDTNTASQAYFYQPNGFTNPHASAIPLGHGRDIDPFQAQAHAHAQYFTANEHQDVYSSLRMSTPVIPNLPGPPPSAMTATTATTTANPANLFSNTNTNTNINTNIQYQTATCALWPSSNNIPSSLVTLDSSATYRPTTGWSYYPPAAPQQFFPPQSGILGAHSPSLNVPQVYVQPASTTTPTQPTFASMSRGPFVMPTHHNHNHHQQQQQQHGIGGAFQHPTTSAHPIPPYLVLSPVDTPAHGPVFPSPLFAPQVQVQVQAQAHPSTTPLDMNFTTGAPMQAAGATGAYDFLLGGADPFPGTTAADGWSPLSDHSGSSGSPPTTYSPAYSTPLSTAGGPYQPPSAYPGMADASTIPRIRRTAPDGVPLFRTAVLPHLQHLQHATWAVPGPANPTPPPNPNPNLTLAPTPHPAPAPHPADDDRGGVIPQRTAAGAGSAQRRFKNQKLVADIAARRRNLPRGGPLDALVARILAADWFRNDEEEPTYRDLGPPALTLTPTPAPAPTLRDGQSIFLAFQDDAQRCVLCGHREARPKPNRMVRHIRMHFDLRPYECRVPSCPPCRQGRKRFHSREDLNDHQRVRRRVECPIDTCRRRLLENNLQRHMMKQHKDIVGASGLYRVSPSDSFESPAF